MHLELLANKLITPDPEYNLQHWITKRAYKLLIPEHFPYISNILAKYNGYLLQHLFL